MAFITGANIGESVLVFVCVCVCGCISVVETTVSGAFEKLCSEVNHKNMKTTFILHIGQMFSNFVSLSPLSLDAWMPGCLDASMPLCLGQFVQCLSLIC